MCNCPAGGGETTIQLPCGTTDAPVVKTIGACTVAQPGPQTLYVVSDVAGTCHVELTLASGATSSTAIEFVSDWLPCGSDPHGCGQGVTATPSRVPIGNQCADAGVDAGSSD